MEKQSKTSKTKRVNPNHLTAQDHCVPDDEVLVNENVVAKILGVSVQTLRNNRHNRKGIPYVKLGRSVRYFLKDVHDYALQRRIAPELNAA